jgi:hypothetical protein
MQRAAQLLSDLRQSGSLGAEWPSSIQSTSNPADIVQEIQSRAIMRVPDNHVQPIRDFVEAYIRSSDVRAEALGLKPSDPSFETQLQALLGRIQGAGVNTWDYRDVLLQQYPNMH